MSDHWRQRRKRYYEWLNRLDKSDIAERNLDEMLRRVLGSSDSENSGVDKGSEPLVDVFEDKESVVVVTELIGIDKSNVDLHTTADRLTISVDSPECKFHTEIQLPTKVDVESSSSRLKNGVLEIRLKKLGEELVVR